MRNIDLQMYTLKHRHFRILLLRTSENEIQIA